MASIDFVKKNSPQGFRAVLPRESQEGRRWRRSRRGRSASWSYMVSVIEVLRVSFLSSFSRWKLAPTRALYVMKNLLNQDSWGFVQLTITLVAPAAMAYGPPMLIICEIDLNIRISGEKICFKKSPARWKSRIRSQIDVLTLGKPPSPEWKWDWWKTPKTRKHLALISYRKWKWGRRKTNVNGINANI